MPYTIPLKLCLWHRISRLMSILAGSSPCIACWSADGLFEMPLPSHRCKFLFVLRIHLDKHEDACNYIRTHTQRTLKLRSHGYLNSEFALFLKFLPSGHGWVTCSALGLGLCTIWISIAWWYLCYGSNLSGVGASVSQFVKRTGIKEWFQNPGSWWHCYVIVKMPD